MASGKAVVMDNELVVPEMMNQNVFLKVFLAQKLMIIKMKHLLVHNSLHTPINQVKIYYYRIHLPMMILML